VPNHTDVPNYTDGAELHRRCRITPTVPNNADSRNHTLGIRS